MRWKSWAPSPKYSVRSLWTLSNIEKEELEENVEARKRSEKEVELGSHNELLQVSTVVSPHCLCDCVPHSC